MEINGPMAWLGLVAAMFLRALPLLKLGVAIQLCFCGPCPCCSRSRHDLGFHIDGLVSANAMPVLDSRKSANTSLVRLRICRLSSSFSWLFSALLLVTLCRVVRSYSYLPSVVIVLIISSSYLPSVFSVLILSQRNAS